MSEILKEETNLSDVEKLFAKKFAFEKNYDWELPPLDVLFKDNSWLSKNLINIKFRLNNVKTRLADMDDKWHHHTSEVNKSKKVLKAVKDDIQPVFLSNAWCKFIEVLCTFPLIRRQRKSFHSLHLCEAPGGFISALNYYLCLFHGANFKWKWYANTLNPYYEGHSLKKVVVDDRLLFPTIHQWYFGNDNTGDITSTMYQADIVNVVCNSDISMVTSDGGVDCSDHLEEQESFLTVLKFSEVIVSLENLCTDGCCVLKRFTLFECISVCTLYLLNCIFKEVHVFKPATSKAGNSEIYVICLGYIGKDKMKSYISHLKKFYGSQDLAMFPECYVPLSFMQQLEKCCKMFADFQIDAILENIDSFSNGSSGEGNKLNEIQDVCARLYFQKFFLKPLPINQHYSLLGNKKMRTALSYGNSLYDLKTIYYKITNVKKQGTWKEHLRDIERRLNECFPEDQTQKCQMLNTWYPVWKEIRNRKHAYDQNWITLGKSFSFVMNSKFCNPMILFLWNEISCSEQVQSSNYCGNANYIWEWDSSQCLVKECDAIRNTQTLIIIESFTKESNPILMGLNYLFEKNIKVMHGISFDEPFPCVNHPTTFVLDTSIWLENSLNPEIFIMKRFLLEIHRLIQVLETNDCLIVILQSQLTRFTVGVLYMVLSFFSAVSMLPPLPNSSPTAGVVWVLCNFQKPSWSEKIFEYMKDVLRINEKELAVVEVVPLTLLCGSHFFDVLVDLNNRFVLQKIRSLLKRENMKIQTNANQK